MGFMITVFTPAYNRAHLLPRLYESLKGQTFKDFEWLVVDDGSTDDTEAVMHGFIKENLLDIRYIKQENGGKHRAINRGVKEARGELFFIVDSDDILPTQSLERVNYHYSQTKEDSRFAGVCGLCCYFDGSQAGGEQDFGTIDCIMLDIRQKHHIRGDMAEVFRTSVLKEFPFPEIEGERFCPEDLVWNRISQKYIMRFFHENIYECEYQPDGLSAKIVRIRMNSPIASVTHYAELNFCDISFLQKMKAAINYWRFRFCYNGRSELPQLSRQWHWAMAIGWAMHIRDKMQSR